MDIESFVRVEAWSELTYVRFGGCVERHSWHRRFVAGRTRECYEHRTGASCVPERRQERSCEEGGENCVASDQVEVFFLGPFVEPWKMWVLRVSLLGNRMGHK